VSRIAIVGAGNLGSFLGAHLARAGHDVFFCVRRPAGPFRVAGLEATTLPWFTARPPAAEIVLLTVKAHDTRRAQAWFPDLCAQGAPVAVIQNGVHHAARVAPWPAIPVLSYVYVEAREGVFQAFAPPREHFTVADDPRARAFAALFAGAPIGVHCEPAFVDAAWRKMLHNCVSNPLTALAGRGLEILQEPRYRDWAERILAEALPIAQADGAALGGGEPARILEILASYPPGTRTSMLQDRERGKRLELDVLNGALVELGRRYRLPAPVNEDLVARLSDGLPQHPRRM
jgi:2-dehydropantoate 2-reductase